MILTKEDLKRYLDADQEAMDIRRKFRFVDRFSNPVWHFQRLLRKREYIYNTRFWWTPFAKKWNAFWYHRLERRLGFTIHPNCFGPGLYITHYGTLVVHSSARIGKNCEINVGVNIGSRDGDSNQVPIIGDNCFIGPGVKIFGKVVIGDNVKIGANAVVNKSFPEGNCTLVGIPAKAIRRM